MRNHGKMLLIALATWLNLAPTLTYAAEPRYDRRWFYAPTNLLVKENADQLISLIDRAAKSGYNGMLLADYKFNILGRMPENYFQNVARIRQAADRAGIEIIPALFPIGYSNGLLAHDPNLAEGLPAETMLVVKGREAKLAPDPATKIVNGDFEEAHRDLFPGFGFQDDPGKATFADHQVVHHGKTSCRFQDVGKNVSHGNGRLIQHVKVHPHGCYRLSCWVKTKDLQSPGAFSIKAIGASEGGKPLTFQEGGIEPNQDWKRVEVVFNSVNEAEINVYVGLWGGGTGTLWVDEFQIEELALVNVLRRDGCPFVVASQDGKTIYKEGKDYEPVADPKLGRVPYEGEYEFGHPGAAVKLTAKSRIKNGQRLRVTWYHPIITHNEQVMCCLSEPKVYDLLGDQARRVNDLLHPRTFFMSHDEIRVANWCQACQARKLNPGAMLADNVKRCVAVLKKINPNARVVVWSDMFDPHHNAVDDYYLVNGTLAGSWEGLTPDVIIANWNSGKAAESLKWFADRGHPQLIAGYYDAGLDNFRTWDAAARGVPKIIGFMYTTWQNNYGDLEAYGQAMRGESPKPPAPRARARRAR
jgi:hypothetical protein